MASPIKSVAVHAGEAPSIRTESSYQLRWSHDECDFDPWMDGWTDGPMDEGRAKWRYFRVSNKFVDKSVSGGCCFDFALVHCCDFADLLRNRVPKLAVGMG